MIEIITISAAILLLWILLYPVITRFCKIFHLGREQMNRKSDKRDHVKLITSEQEVSVIGKSTSTLRQPLPITATPIAEEPINGDDASTFAPESDPVPMDVDYPLDRETDDEIDEEQEAIELKEMFGKDVYFASGVVIDELHKIKHVIESPVASQSEKQEAGKILYENKETEIVEQLSSGKTGNIVSNLIDLHIALHQKEQGISKDITESEELENFDVNKFLNLK